MAYTKIADAAAASTNGNSATTAGVDTTGATLIALFTSYDGAGESAPTDSKGNSWGSAVFAVGSNPTLRMYLCANPTVGAGHTFTESASGHFPSIAMLAFSGNAATPSDQTSSATAVQPGSVTPSEDNELVLTAYAHGAVVTPSVDSPFDAHTTSALPGDANSYALGLAYEIQTTATARNPTWSGGSGTAPKSLVITLKAAGGGTQTISPAGSCTPTGALAKSVSKAPAGSCTAAGAIAKQAAKPLAGSTTAAGALAKAAAKALAGSSTATAALAKQAQKPLAGNCTSSGALSAVKVVVRALAGAVTAAGTLVRSALKALAGRITGSGSLSTSGGSTPTAEPERVGLVARYAPRVELVATDSSRTSLTARSPT